MRKREWIIEIIVFLFIVLFLYAAGSKLIDYPKFVGQIGKSPLLTNYARLIAWLIPSIEILVSVMLIVPKTRLIGFYASFGLMTSFTFYIVAILLTSEELPCSCGGVLAMLSWREHLVFNILFVVLSMFGIVLINKVEHRNAVVQG